MTYTSDRLYSIPIENSSFMFASKVWDFQNLEVRFLGKETLSWSYMCLEFVLDL